MRVFITGATGYIGAAVCRALKARGHEVVGLTRGEAGARRLEALGARAARGDVKLPDSYRKEAQAADALIHAAFEYGSAAIEADRLALDTLIAAGKPLIYTSGVWVLGPRSEAAADEDSPVSPLDVVAWRPAHEDEALRAGAVVLRPGCVYGGRGGLYGQMIQDAVDGKPVTLCGEGENRWASVDLDDLAALYALLIEKKARRAIYHATDGRAEPLRRGAQALARAAGGGEVRAVPLVELSKKLGPFAAALAVDQLVSSEKARRDLGWKANGAGVAARAVELVKAWKAGA